MTKMITLLIVLLLRSASATTCALGCLQCDLSTNCLECDLANMYFLKSGVCVKSIARRCAQIDPNGKCIECLQGNYFYRGLVCVSVISIDNCVQYNPRASSTVCQACSSETILYENKCLTPIENCEAYDVDTGLCFLCKRQFRLSLTWRQCLVGLIRYCDYYDTIGYCRQCNPVSPRLSARRTACFSLINGCALHASNQDSCLECDADLQKSADSKHCYPEIKGCQTYDESGLTTGTVKCATCHWNYLLSHSQSSSSCINQLFNCVDFNLEQKKCQMCNERSVLTTDSLICLAKIDNCKVYSLSTFQNTVLSCSECESSFRIATDSVTNAAICRPSISGCVGYDQKDSSVCSSCDPMFRLSADQKMCIRFIPNCDVYSDSISPANSTCQACITGFQLSSDSQECIKNVVDCTAFSEKGDTCLKCAAGKIVTSDGLSCLLEIEHCQQYAPSDQTTKSLECVRCKESFQVFGEKQICVPIISGCVQRNETDLTCIKCENGLLLTDDRLKCLPEIHDCVKYQKSTWQSQFHTCELCDSKRVSFNSGTSCMTPLPNCARYNNTVFVCDQCESGYIMANDANACYSPILNCESHLTPISSIEGLKCDKCAEDFILSSDAKQCYPVIINCLRQSKDSLSCLECGLGFTSYADATKCVPRIENCLQLTPYDSNNPQIKCAVCANTFEVRKNGAICAPIIEGCSQRDSSEFTCAVCDSGLAVTTDGLACLPSVPNCSGYLPSLKTNSYLICKNCSEGYEVVNNGKLCLEVILNCASRNSSTYLCDSCVSDYVMSSDKMACFAIIENCSVHKSFLANDTALQCEVCKDGFVASLNNTKCILDIQHCIKRDSSGLCLECSPSWLPTLDGRKCLPIIPKCAKYTQDSNINFSSFTCVACESGFIIKDNTCTPIPVIANCDSQNQITGICTTCAKNFIRTSDSLACLPAITNCATYSTIISGDIRQLFCTTCITGQVPTTDGLACLSEVTNCNGYGTSTVLTKTLTCISCVSNYDIENGVCVKVGIDNCIFYIKELDTCGFCNTDFYMTDDSKACLPDISFCVAVDPSSASTPFLTCSACLSSFVLSNDRRKCFPRIRFCLQYATNSFQSEKLMCTKCEILYQVQSDGSCARKIIPNCRQMSTVTALCTQCNPSFVVTTDGEKCLAEVPKCLTYAPSNINSTQLICVKCVDEATLTQDNICYDGTIPYCTNFDAVAKLCNRCDLGKVVTSDQLKCIDPIYNCETYAPSTINTISSSCEICKTGYQPFFDGKVCGYQVTGCTQYDNTTLVCKACSPDYHPSTDGRLCLSDIPLCQVYDFATIDFPAVKCLQCQTGYMVDSQSNSCIPKEIQNCSTIDILTGLCLECKTNFRLTDDKELCLEHVPNCRLYMESSKFSTLFQCIQCRAGYQLIALSCILRPISFCEERNTQTGLCKTCIEGKRVTDDGEICLDEIDNCALYEPSSKTTEEFTCIECAPDSFFLGKYCVRTISSCSVYNERYFYCDECKPNYNVTSDGEKCLPSIDHCDYYAFSTANTAEFKCEYCANGYIPDTQGRICNAINPPTSTQATAKTSPDSGTTEPLVYPSDQVTSCEAGWQLTDDGKRCLPKIDSCLIYEPTTQKSLQNVCLKCKDGYTLGLNGEVCSA